MKIFFFISDNFLDKISDFGPPSNNRNLIFFGTDLNAKTLQDNLAEFFALYGGNHGFLNLFSALAYDRIKTYPRNLNFLHKAKILFIYFMFCKL